ncbi:MAG: zinc ribbon domain-containing protein [Dehalococcoidales bacterium]
MPIYEYICSGCQSRFELLRPMSRSGDGVLCPRCHSPAERALSTFACFSRDESGLTSSVAGASCSSCRATSCDSCGP